MLQRLAALSLALCIIGGYFQLFTVRRAFGSTLLLFGVAMGRCDGALMVCGVMWRCVCMMRCDAVLCAPPRRFTPLSSRARPPVPHVLTACTRCRQTTPSLPAPPRPAHLSLQHLALPFRILLCGQSARHTRSGALCGWCLPPAECGESHLPSPPSSHWSSTGSKCSHPMCFCVCRCLRVREMTGKQ